MPLLTICCNLRNRQFATTPFKGANRVATFANVLKHDVTFPDSPHVTSQVLPPSRDSVTVLIQTKYILSSIVIANHLCANY